MGDKHKIFMYVNSIPANIGFVVFFFIFALESCGGKRHYSIVLSKAARVL